MLEIGSSGGSPVFVARLGRSYLNKEYPDGERGTHIHFVDRDGKPLLGEELKMVGTCVNDLRKMFTKEQLAILRHFYPEAASPKVRGESLTHDAKTDEVDLVYTLFPE